MPAYAARRILSATSQRPQHLSMQLECDAVPAATTAKARSHVMQYYGIDREKVDEFKTSVCGAGGKLSAQVLESMKSLHPEVISKWDYLYYNYILQVIKNIS